jgi:anthranilate synthase component II
VALAQACRLNSPARARPRHTAQTVARSVTAKFGGARRRDELQDSDRTVPDRLGKQMLLMIDNYDSFTYNLVQYLGELGQQVKTVRNDAIDIAGIEALAPERIVVSPGPGTPDEAGISLEVLRQFGARLPILGVCLGHQAIGQAFGGTVVRAQRVMHGKVDRIETTGAGIFRDLPRRFDVARYHSLVVDRQSLPDCLEVTAWTDDGEIMGLRHRDLPIEGVQFHPESIASEHGHALLRNFLSA